MAAYGVQDSMLLERGGVTYGIFGLMGEDSHDCAPTSGFVLEDRADSAQRCVDSLREQVDYLILDTAPCGLFQDAAIVADWADAALMVVRYDTVTKNNIAEALSMLDSRQAEVIGYVLNAFPQSSTGYGYVYGRYGYGKYGYGAYGSKYSELPEEEVAEEDPTLAPV